MKLYKRDRNNVSFVARHMRELDYNEITSVRFADDLSQVIDDTLMAGPLTFVLGDEEAPIAVVGAAQQHPTLYQVFMYATDDFRKIWRSVSRFTIRGIMPQLIAQGMTRAECRSKEDHTPAHHWLEFLGARFEGVCRSHGKYGDDYFLYAWTKEDVINRMPKPKVEEDDGDSWWWRRKQVGEEDLQAPEEAGERARKRP